MVENDPDWEDSDVPVGWAMLLITILILICAIGGIFWTGYNRMALIGWPFLGGLVFVFFRIWKTMLRNTVDDVVETVDLKGNIFDDTPVSFVRDRRENEKFAVSKTTFNLIGLTFGFVIYAIFITLFWYGVGRGVRWVVDLF